MEVITTDEVSRQFDIIQLTKAIVNLICGTGSPRDELNNNMGKFLNTLKNTMARMREIIEKFFRTEKKKKEEQDRCLIHVLVMAALLLSYVNTVTFAFIEYAVVLLAVFLHKCRDRESSDPLSLYVN
jgi:hypothetical protein